MKSLKTLIVTSVVTLTILGSVVFFLVSIKLANNSLDEVYTTDIQDMITLVAQFVEKENNSKIETISTISNLPFMSDPSLSMAEKQLQLDEIATHNDNILDITIASPNGMIQRTGKNPTSISNRTDFINANNGKTGVFGPIRDEDNLKLLLYYSVPIFNNGKVVNVLSIAIDGQILSQIVSDFTIGGVSHPFILDRYTSQILGHEDFSLVSTKHNYMDDANQPGVEELSSAIFSFNSIEEEIFYFTRNKNWIYLPYSQISGTSWGVCAEIPEAYLKQSTKPLRTNLFIIAFALLGGGIILSIFVGRATNPLRVLGNTITDIGSGSADLTTRLELKHVKKEIGNVVNGFNNFVGKLHEIVSSVHESELKLSEVNQILQTSAQETASSISQIITNIESVSGQIQTESSSVDATAGAINEIAANIESLERMINGQAESVAAASSAIEEMVGNINSVNNSVNIMVKYFATLEENAKIGIQTQNDVNERLQRIDEQSQMLVDANVVISDIAEQTNLLAMNAAIEAAHAGETGKGFSVVADEIRKLSENSSSQSEVISKELNEIKQSIAIVVNASSKASEAFAAVSADISKTDEVVHMIMGAMEEQQVGSKQITEALFAMNDSTTEVKSAASEMANGSNHILNEVQALQSATLSMNDSISQMAVGAQRINDSGSKLSSITQEVSDSIQIIQNEIGQFKI